MSEEEKERQLLLLRRGEKEGEAGSGEPGTLEKWLHQLPNSSPVHLAFC